MLARRHLHHTRTTGTPPDLARALADLGAVLHRLGEHGEQLRVAREAVALCRGLADGTSARQSDLAHALGKLSVALHWVGEHGEQLEVAREEVELYRELAAHTPELFHQTYIDKRAAFRGLILQHGDEDDITFGL